MFRFVFFLLFCPLLLMSCKSKDQVKRLAELEQQVATMTEELEVLEAEKAVLLEHSLAPLDWGTFFEVQIGAFVEFNLSRYIEDFVRLKEVNHDGMNKYVLGRFRRYDDAVRFRRDIQKMGIDDAFIVAMVDGERIIDEDEVRRIGWDVDKNLDKEVSNRVEGVD